MARRVVILEDGAIAHLLQGRQDQGPDNRVPVRHAGQTALDDVQGGSMVKAKPTPHHHGPAAMLIMLPDGGVRVSLSGVSPDADAPVVESQRESGLVSEEDPRPLVPCPVLMNSCELPPT